MHQSNDRANGTLAAYSHWMITITLINVSDLVENRKGWFVANVVGAFVDLEARVEEIVMDKLRETFASEGISAVISAAPVAQDRP